MCWTLYPDPSGTEWRYGIDIATLSPSMINTSGCSLSCRGSEWRCGIDAVVLSPAYFVDTEICGTTLSVSFGGNQDKAHGN